MRVPLTWLREYADVPAGTTPRQIGDALIRLGLEVETVEEIDVTGPLVVGRVLDFEEETHKNGKTVRWCQVDVGDAGTAPGTPQGIVCGARNFAVGDLVVVSLPGAVLPGGFEIASRKTYGHVSDGMICSVRELGIGEDHDGILVLDADDACDPQGRPVVPGSDARPVIGLPEAVLDIAVTPDRGYCLSVRGVARELAAAFGTEFADPAAREVPPATDEPAYPVRLADPAGCDRFVARRVTGVDPEASSPLWLRRRLHLAGMRPISLLVDVTNHVMLDLGQPIHGYDERRLSGPIVVRRATEHETLVTLDEHVRDLHSEDLLITDDSGAIGLAGVMGGATTELSSVTSEVLVEAAHFDAASIAATARRHRLPSEASKRFERGVDPALPAVAADLVVELLVRLAGGVADDRVTDVDLTEPASDIELELGFPGRLVGAPIEPDRVREHLRQVGCTVSDSPVGPDRVLVRPPSWRPDLTGPVYLVEEVVRLEGYDTIPARVPTGPSSQRRNREVVRTARVTRALAHAGGIEVRNYPFLSEQAIDQMGFAADAAERRLVRIVNPVSDQEPYLRTLLLPGLAATLARNVGRGFTDVTLFEIGKVFRAREDRPLRTPQLPVDRRPSDEQLAALDAGLPDEAWRVAAVMTGKRERAGWWGPGRDAAWYDAVQLARLAAKAIDVPVQVKRGSEPPFHPGRCAQIVAAGQPVGHAGELHPRVLSVLGLPSRTCAMELDLRTLARYEEPIARAPHPSTFPIATTDIALAVPESVPAAEVEAALWSGGGELLESIDLFDVFVGDQVGQGRRSLAYTLRLRAPDRTLTDADIAQVREMAVASAAAATGAILRSG